MHETKIFLDDHSFTLRPTFEALSSIEQSLNSGIVALTNKLVEGQLTLDEVAVIITQCAPQGTPIALVKEAIIKNGLTRALGIIASMLSCAFAGDNEQAGISREELEGLI